MSEQERFPVGTRVRPRYGPPGVEGEVIEPLRDLVGYGVRWNDGTLGWKYPEHLKRAAPVHTLAPGIEQSDDTADGKPCLAGTRTPTDVVRGWRDWADFSPHFPYVTEPEYDRAVLFEAGVAWERERRRRRKERRAVRRYERVKALAEGAGDAN